MTKQRSSGGDFDPVSATIWKPNRIQLDSGEHKVDKANPILVLETRIKPFTQYFVREQQNQGHATSSSDLKMEIRSEGGAEQLTADMWVLHRGNRYDIKGFLGFNWEVGTALYQVSKVNDYNGDC